MGSNTIAVLNEARISDWPLAIREAHAGTSRHRAFPGDFGYGRILTRAEAGTALLCTVGGNTGNEAEAAIDLSLAQAPKKEPVLLGELRFLLAGHGYFTRRPGRTRGEGPLSWGYAEGCKAGDVAPPETSPVVGSQEAGVAILLLNDFGRDWPAEILRAMTLRGPVGAPVAFGYGQVLSVAHADYQQIAGIAGAGGQALSPSLYADPRFLGLAADILRRHGHAVRAPGAAHYADPIETHGPRG